MMRTQVTRKCSKRSATLRQVRRIRRSGSSEVLQSLVVALVLSGLEYGSATLTDLPTGQAVQNAAARLISACRRDHVQPLLRIGLHSLRVPERISFRLAVLVYCCTRLPGDRTAARLRPPRTSTITLFRHVTLVATHVPCYHRQPRLPGSCCICLEQSAGVSTCISVTDNFPP